MKYKYGYIIHVNGTVYLYPSYNVLKGEIIELWLNGLINIKNIIWKKDKKETRGYVV